MTFSPHRIYSVARVFLVRTWPRRFRLVTIISQNCSLQIYVLTYACPMVPFCGGQACPFARMNEFFLYKNEISKGALVTRNEYFSVDISTVSPLKSSQSTTDVKMQRCRRSRERLTSLRNINLFPQVYNKLGVNYPQGTADHCSNRRQNMSTGAVGKQCAEPKTKSDAAAATPASRHFCKHNCHRYFRILASRHFNSNVAKLMVRHKAEAGTPPRWHQFEPYHFALDNMTAKSYWIRGRLNSDY